jgi:hypothetical protein
MSARLPSPDSTTLATWAENEALPIAPWPKTGECSCGCDNWRDVEHGYVRSSGATFEDGVLTVYPDGWDDLSENGDGERYVQCESCGKRYDYTGEVSYL